LAQSYVGGLYKDQGLAATKAWLDKLFTPYVREAYRIVREQHGLPPLGPNNELQAATGAGPTPPTPPPEPPRMDRMATTTQGHLGLFNQRLQQQNKAIEWVFDDTITESNRATPVWAAKALIDGACWGHGRGNTKKAAKNEAAKQGLRHMGFDEVSAPSIHPSACHMHQIAAVALYHYSHARHRITSLSLQTGAGMCQCAPSCPCVESQACNCSAMTVYTALIYHHIISEDFLSPFVRGQELAARIVYMSIQTQPYHRQGTIH